MASSGIPALDGLLSGGYPDKSVVLVVGQAGIGKEALGYWFCHSGKARGDYCLYITHRPVADVSRDMKGFGVDNGGGLDWIASAGTDKRLDLRDPTAISFNMKQMLQQNKDRRVRVVTDILSPLLTLNPTEGMYAYWTQLIAEVKRYDAVLLATAEQGMHTPGTLASLEELFDGVVEMRLYEEGLVLTPLLRVKKMLGQLPTQAYYRFAFKPGVMEVLAYVR